MEDKMINDKKLKALDIQKWKDLITDWEKTKESQKAFYIRLGMKKSRFTEQQIIVWGHPAHYFILEKISRGADVTVTLL